jgi:two-component system cell cycle sensor histidine kinase PleC
MKKELKSVDEISEFAENIINTVREPLLVLDKDLRVVKASRSFFDFFKVSTDETIGTLIYDLGNQQWNIPKLRELLETILPEKTTFDNYEVEHDFSTIGKRIMLLNARQIERALGKEKIILVAIEDITDRKKIESALNKAKEMAESADRFKSAFLATMSHELRTPLNSIIGFTGILLNELPGPLNEEQSKQLNMIKGSGQDLLELINDVLDISKIEAGELVVSLKPFTFSKSINKVVSIVKLLADKNGLELRSNISPDVNNIISDERRVEQVFLNILNNAIKFTEQGSIEINCVKQNDHIITRIIDTGIGIKKEDMEKLFKPFSQIEMGITRTRSGTGLGLSICKKLLEKLNGTISVESQFRVGSIFTVTLPIDGE